MSFLLATAALAALVATPRPEPAPADRVPSGYVNDWAGVLPDAARQTLEERLTRFEKDTTNPIVVALYETVPAPDLETFTRATANRWGVGRKGADNGVVIFVFTKDRKMRVEVGKGLDRLTDAKAHQVLDRMKPRFRDGDFAGGLAAGIDAVIEILRE